MSEIQIDVQNPKLRRTLERFKAKIVEGDFYEAHQTLRTIANRNVRTRSFNDAIDLLFHGAQILLKSSQPATGSDLTLYLLEVYNDSETPVNSDTKSRLITLISLFKSDEVTLKQVGVAIINWSIKFGDNKLGDQDLHNALGQKFLDNGELAYDAERHLLLGNSGSFSLYLALIWSWYQEDPNDNNIEKYISRIVLNYLFIQNFKNSKEALNKLLANFIKLKPNYTHQEINEFNTSVLIFEEFPILNLLQLLLVTIQTKNTEFYKKLTSRYSSQISENQLSESFTLLGELYFGISAPRQGNILQDLMKGVLGG